ncbi:assimilatory sulfite reductase (NADPH) flavoprotein subunit [Bacillus thermotolerans]|uniref:assimilatory sulfite reductase (NADPH) flavoprotein subunit n=1 Tax=Bacillus thermotolerans TaxID=1221996 RepID=UPI0005800F07|nr:assimilatory sulfite reductase (NADPH) flavoprotein subunit [Bacillus thermotolerans]KKB34794.1 Sulfite reductase [NADPH] flavoprotein alpha-component [Bacillus thermotolerans]
MQLQVMNSPFTEEQVELLNRLLSTLTESQKAWLSGYLAAPHVVSSTDAPFQGVPGAELLSQAVGQSKPKEATVLFGSQTGNAQALAEKLSEKLKGRGFEVTTSAMSDFKPNNLKKVHNLFIVVSTHGEGDPPDNALSFHEFLHGRRAPQLKDLQFSVLALGDSSYEFFCQTGKEFDKRLEELGGKRLYPRFDCDVDFEEAAAEWTEGVLSSLAETESASLSNGSDQLVPQAAGAAAVQTEVVYSRANPFKAEVLENINLNGRGSNKETRHLELLLEGSNLEYEPGDSLGVYPQNDPELVDQVIEAMKWNPDELVPVNKQQETQPLREALLTHYEITPLTKPVLEKVAEISESEELKKLVAAGREEIRAYIDGRDLLDVITDFNLQGVSAETLVPALRKMAPRLYSIASSLKANPEEVHLTIGAVRYNANGRDRKGVCSIQCAERLQPGDHLPVFIQRNKNFRLPDNPDTPVIMVGPGTGVAPFRSFLQEREEMAAQGKTWMFFGDQHFRTDFLYQTEWQQWLKKGVLTKMDVAFSRDTEEKVYVQHRMLEKSAELYQWLEEGAFFYVCGDKNNMARDVHETLIQLIEREGNMSRAQAEAYLADMQKQKRYQRDVY